MIETKDIQRVSEAIQAKAVGGRVYPLPSGNEFRYVPADKSKAQRTVAFLTNSRVLCVDAKTGETCPANEFHRPCYHIARVALYLYRVQRRQKEAA
jgi:hypothetical protein